MKSFLKELNIYNVRVFSEKKILFKPHINVLCGKNGSGKTTILESIYIANYGRSFKEKGLSKVLKNGESEFSIKLIISSDGVDSEIFSHYSNFKLKRAIDGKRKRTKDIIERIFTIFLSGEVSYKLRFSNSERVRMVDRFIMGYDELYIVNYLKYNKIIRNIRKIENKNEREEYKEFWKNYLEKEKDFLQKKRKEFLKNFNENLNGIEISFVPSNELFSADKIYFKLGNEEFGKERSSGEFYQFVLKVFLSYQRFLYKNYKKYSLLLIDDFDSFMDDEKMRESINDHGDFQVILTSLKVRNFFDSNLILLEE